MKKNPAMKHFHFIAATVVFRVKLNEKEYSDETSMPLNTVVTTKDGQLPAYVLGHAQQAVQLALFKRLGEEAANCEVADVVITNIMHLGVFSDESFNAKPEAPKGLPEDVKAALELVK